MLFLSILLCIVHTGFVYYFWFSSNDELAEVKNKETFAVCAILLSIILTSELLLMVYLAGILKEIF